ncbi:MAG: alpha-L-fucosidase [Kiritimatiellae bacterium]|jgi:signal recognition particle subunit SEC65|nr:alpha-L-fucosidase [Kiritimatiellia bacterium]
MNNTPNEWFAKRQLGLFIHFGLYSIEAWHEQDQMRRRIPRKEYKKLAKTFNPSNFNADEILDFAEQVGMTYICITTKHHDGFCLWDTKETNYNIMNTPYRKDLIKELGTWYNKVKESFIDTTFASDLTSNNDVILTKTENTLYVHIPQPLKADAILLPPISQLPESATLLNTEETIQTSNDVLPMFWQENQHILRLRNLPTNLPSNCPLIIKLEFADLSSLTTSKPAIEFEG